jgi:elongation factor 1-gamma
VTGAANDQKVAVNAMLGQKPVEQAAFTESMNKIKANAKILNAQLKGKQYLVNDTLSLADLVVACGMIVAQQTMLDAGFRKAMPDYGAWFERVVANADFVAVCGAVKSCAKSIKPQIAAPAVKKEEKKQAPKKEAGGDDDDEDKPAKKAKSALELLPKTDFDLFNFKTFFVNEPDRYGSAVDEFLKMYDKEGWSCHHMHYEMYVDSKGVRQEGVKVYHSENMIDGFLQRWEDFRNWSFGRMCLLGTEDAQEIKGVFMWRGQGVPKECDEHPSFEYYKRRQLDIVNNKEDLALLRAYWGSKPDDTIEGMKAISCKWQK